MAAGSRHHVHRAEQIEPQAALQLRQNILQVPASHRECFLSAQRLPPHLHSLRQAGTKLPRLHLPCRCYRMVDLMSLGPSCPGRRVLFTSLLIFRLSSGMARFRTSVRRRLMSALPLKADIAPYPGNVGYGPETGSRLRHKKLGQATLACRPATIDRHDVARNMGGRIRAQKDDDLRDFLRLTPMAERND